VTGPPVAVAIVTSRRGVLAGRKRAGRPFWTFPGVELHLGEAPGGALVREVARETGLEVQYGKVLGCREHPRTGQSLTYLACRLVGRPVEMDPVSDELSELRWLTLFELDLLMPGVYGPVRHHLTQLIPE
jgi:ADP-ribose pyrophosphatase YjhB (NUDIX family)